MTDSDSTRKTPRDIVRIHFPWNVAPDVADADPYLSMRAYGDWVATGGHGLSEATLERARSLVQLLRQNNAVLEYDPTLPAAAGLSNRGGFALRDRTPADDDLLVRDNEHTNLTVEGRMIWRFQHVDP